MFSGSTTAKSWYAVTPDMLTGRMVNVREAIFVMGSTIGPCYSPGALCFESLAHAKLFARAYGGQLCNLHEAIAWLHSRMTRPGSSKVGVAE